VGIKAIVALVASLTLTSGPLAASPQSCWPSDEVCKAFVKHDVGETDYQVQLNGGKIGWVDVSSPFLIDYDPVDRPKQSEECARRGQPKISMTAAGVIETCWAKPLRIVKKTTAAGVEENFVYGVGHIVKFTDGKVSEIVEAR
jgi:hypothetical protein